MRRFVILAINWTKRAIGEEVNRFRGECYFLGNGERNFRTIALGVTVLGEMFTGGLLARWSIFLQSVVVDRKEIGASIARA